MEYSFSTHFRFSRKTREGKIIWLVIKNQKNDKLLCLTYYQLYFFFERGKENNHTDIETISIIQKMVLEKMV